MWRGLGALIVGASIHIWVPRDRVSTVIAPRPDDAKLTALRLADGNLSLPEFTLWGAGPPVDLQYHVAVSAPAIAPVVLTPETAPLRKISPTPSKPTPISVPADSSTATVPAPAALTSHPRTVAPRIPADGEGSATAPQKQGRKVAATKCADGGAAETGFSYGADIAIDSPAYPKITLANRCPKR